MNLILKDIDERLLDLLKEHEDYFADIECFVEEPPTYTLEELKAEYKKRLEEIERGEVELLPFDENFDKEMDEFIRQCGRMETAVEQMHERKVAKCVKPKPRQREIYAEEMRVGA